CFLFFFFFQAEDGIRDLIVTGVQTCALPIWPHQPGIINPSIKNPTLNVRERTFGFRSNNGIFVVRSDDSGLNWNQPVALIDNLRSEERRVGKEWRSRCARETEKNKKEERIDV